jgi:hypothetical protein
MPNNRYLTGISFQKYGKIAAAKFVQTRYFPMKKMLYQWLNKLGPGLITGAADDDPSGIATYSQAGAQYGFGTLWTLLMTYPLMVGIQVISARIGCVTGRGLAANLARTNSRGVTISLVMLLLVANTWYSADRATFMPSRSGWSACCCRCSSLTGATWEY